jgi:hypothetical protein
MLTICGRPRSCGRLLQGFDQPYSLDPTVGLGMSALGTSLRRDRAIGITQRDRMTNHFGFGTKGEVSIVLSNVRFQG